MEEKDIKLYEKFKSLIDVGFNERDAINFFSTLKATQYDRLIDIFKNNDFPDIKPGTREKILQILQALRLKM
jgi:hypothetical protein